MDVVWTPDPSNCLDLYTISWTDCGANINLEPIHFSIFFHECLAILVVCTLGGCVTSFSEVLGSIPSQPS